MMKKRILLIDDDRNFSDILRRNLEEKGYDVLSAYDGKSGIATARAERPDLIILDIMLPEVNGYTISRFLKFDMKYKSIPIIVFSSRRDAEDLSSEVGADAYIAKSADAEELFNKIDSLLKEKPRKPVEIKIEYPPAPFLKETKEIKDATVDELKSKIKKLVAINEVVYDMNRSFEIDASIKKFIEKISTILTAEISSLMLLDKKKNELVMKIGKGVKDEIIKNARAKLGEGIAGWVAKEAKPLLVDDVNRYPQFKTRNGRDYKTDSFICVPLMADNEVLGVVNVTDKADKTNFTKEDLDTLVSIANNAAVSIKNSMLYEELKRISKVKSDFLAILAHELRAPLINVLGSIEVLLKDSYSILKEDQVKFLSIAKGNIERLARLIDDLLDVSKMEAGGLVMRRNRLDMAGLVRSVAISFKSEADKKAIELVMKIPAGEKTIWGDADRLEQVLDNLLSNAIKFTPEKGRVTLSLEDLGDSVKLSVSDNGPGIPREKLPHVFDKFSSLYIEQDRVRRGTGLGLSITKDIIGMHKGSIRAESEVGKGASFLVELPKDLRKR